MPDAFDINEALNDISTKLKRESQIDLSEQTRKKTKVELIRVIDNENSSSRAFSDRDLSISNSEASSQLNAISKAAVVATQKEKAKPLDYEENKEKRISAQSQAVKPSDTLQIPIMLLDNAEKYQKILAKLTEVSDYKPIISQNVCELVSKTE